MKADERGRGGRVEERYVKCAMHYGVQTKCEQRGGTGW